MQLIFNLYANGKGLKAISNHLNKAGFKTKRNRYFSINGVAQILDNIVYNGKISWLKVEDWDTKRRREKNPNPIIVDGKHDAIISDELWGIVRARRKSRSFKQRQSHEPFLLSGLLRCPNIKAWFQLSLPITRKDGTKRKYRYYVCGDFHNKGSAVCKSNSVKAYEAEESIINRLETFLSSENMLLDTLQEINMNSMDSLTQLNKVFEQIEKRLSEIETLQNRYMDAFENNILPTLILQERLQKIANEKS